MHGRKFEYAGQPKLFPAAAAEGAADSQRHRRTFELKPLVSLGSELIVSESDLQPYPNPKDPTLLRVP